MFKALVFCFLFLLFVQSAYSSVLGRWLADATPIGQFVKVVREKVEGFANPKTIRFDNTASLGASGTAQKAAAQSTGGSSAVAGTQDVVVKVSEDTAGEASRAKGDTTEGEASYEDVSSSNEASPSEVSSQSTSDQLNLRESGKETTNVHEETTDRVAITSSTVASTSKVTPKSKPKPEMVQLTVDAYPSDARIRIMNIRPKYKDGISLVPGQYEIRVDREGYREEMHLVDLEGLEANGDTGARTLNVSLQPLGLPECEENLELDNYAAGVQLFADGGHVLQTKALFRNTDIFDLYQSYAQFLDSRGYFLVYDNVIFPAYYEFHIAAPTNLSMADILNNRKKEIDPERFVMYRTIFEKRGADTFFVQQIFMPLGVEILEASKESICEHYMVF